MTTPPAPTAPKVRGQLEIFVHNVDDPRLDKIIQLLEIIIGKDTVMAGELDALTAQVAANTTIEESALSLIQGLRAQITAAGTDPAKLQALTDQLAAEDAKLAAAIAANTPAAPTT